jgi:hypothetical protein
MYGLDDPQCEWGLIGGVLQGPLFVSWKVVYFFLVLILMFIFRVHFFFCELSRVFIETICIVFSWWFHVVILWGSFDVCSCEIVVKSVCLP